MILGQLDLFEIQGLSLSFSRLIDPEAIVPSLPWQLQHCRADAVAKLEEDWQFAVRSKRKGQQCLYMHMSERLLCSCDGFCGVSEKEAGAHVICRLADENLERIRRLFSNL